MQGLVTIGTAAGSAELEAAAALQAAAPGSRAFVAGAAGAAARHLAETLGADAGRVYEAVAPPQLAAGLDGKPGSTRDELLDAAARAGEGADLLVVATSGGLLAPLAERYSNRDLALELGFPVVVAVAAGPDLLAPALLTIEGASGAGLAVAAVIVTGWPETPPRVLLEERKLLAAHVRVPVGTLPEDAAQAAETARQWPLAEWAQAAVAGPPVAEGSAAGAPRLTLEPYEAWDPQPVGDPRATPRAAIMEGLLEIVGAEGPMTAARAYSLYNRASGGRKLTTVARAPLSSSVYWLAQERKVVLVRREDIPWQDDDVIRMPDSPAVRVRELGPRTLDEVPLDEIAELVRRLRAAGRAAGADEAKRAVLDAYGLKRLTTRADEYLGLALGLVDGDDRVSH
jgi:dethiobiotin synthetase